MKIIEGIRTLKGRPATIPDCSRDDLPEFFKEMGFEVGVEVGVFMADYTRTLASNGMKIYGVDPWLSYQDYEYQKWQDKQNYNYMVSRRRLKKYPNVTLIKKMSMDAVKDFKDNSIDFVYIDGNHRFKWIAEDIMEWSYKVKKGGVICGHDYAYFNHRYVGGGCQVHEIVDAFAYSFDLDFWVLGNYKVLPGEKRDRMRSWLFIKDWNNVE